MTTSLFPGFDRYVLWEVLFSALAGDVFLNPCVDRWVGGKLLRLPRLGVYVDGPSLGLIPWCPFLVILPEIPGGKRIMKLKGDSGWGMRTTAKYSTGQTRIPVE